jgi:hypothetical protein
VLFGFYGVTSSVAAGAVGVWGAAP